METISSSMANPSGHTNPEVEGKKIWNATQHAATAEQIQQGMVDLPAELRTQLSELLTFEELPSAAMLRTRSIAVIGLLAVAGAKCGDRVMIGGAPFLMEELSHSCREIGFVPTFAFSRRESVEKVMPDGSITKTAVFRHLGFVEPEPPQP